MIADRIKAITGEKGRVIVVKLVKTFMRNEDNVKFVPRWLIITELISVFATVILTILIIVSLIKGKYDRALYEGAAIGGLLILSFIADRLDWFHNVTYKFNNTGLTYSYELDNALVLSNSSKVDIKVKTISGIKVHHNGDITLTGEFEKRAPMSKPRIIKKFRFKNIPEHHDEILSGISEIANSV